MNKNQTQTLQQLKETNESLRVSRDMLMEEVKLYAQKFTQQAGTIISLETRIGVLKKDLSAEILRNAILASENEELKQRVDMHLKAQKTFVRDIQRTRTNKWYRRLLGKAY